MKRFAFRRESSVLVVHYERREYLQGRPAAEPSSEQDSNGWFVGPWVDGPQRYAAQATGHGGEQFGHSIGAVDDQ